ncbi:MAG: hypothetical protein J5752_07375 [Clostridiales bacterium]|nr:hypothetical protein [Clostridiales bacterium]
MIWFYSVLAAIISFCLGAFLLFYDTIVDLFFGGGKEATIARLNKPLEGSIFSGQKMTKDMKEAVEPILLSWENADTAYLPARTDKTFRAMQENTIRILQKYGLRRMIRVSATTMENQGKPNNFLSWNDGGRQWREGSATATALEQYINSQGQVVHRNYYRNARLAVRQSRNVKASDLSRDKERRKQGKKGAKDFYEEISAQKCFSCGADIEVRGAEAVCPFCGRPVFANFFDWQTQDFVFEKLKVTRDLGSVIPFPLVTFLTTFLLMFPFGSSIDEDAGFALLLVVAGLVVGTVLTMALIIAWESFFGKKRMQKKVVRFYENLFRSSMLEELWNRADRENTLDLWLGNIKYNKVTNTEDETFITSSVLVGTRTVDANGQIRYSEKKTKLLMVRARYPNRMKSKGEMFQNKSCPSCGVPFLPDDKGCCSYCGYSLNSDNTKWKIKEILS